MKHPERLPDYLQHIREAINDARTFLADCPNVAALAQDKRSQYAIIRALEILGEATARIQRAAPEFIAAHPEIPWSIMRGMRNKMIHEYADIDLEIVYRTVEDDLPPLQKQITDLLARLATL